MKKNKRDYSKCFICGSQNLWTRPKLAFCLECNRSAGDKCPFLGHRYCSPDRCHHRGKKDYFSICLTCYNEKVPDKEVFFPRTGKMKKIVDWQWIIEKQKELEKHELQEHKNKKVKCEL